MLDDEDEVDEGNKIDSCMVSLAGIPEYMYAQLTCRLTLLTSNCLGTGDYQLYSKLVIL